MIATTSILSAPERLVAETRVDFRCAALDSLEKMRAEASEPFVIDMGETRELDASGLGILVLVHKRARERGIGTRLLHTTPSVRTLLAVTKLEALFEFQGEAFEGTVVR